MRVARSLIALSLMCSSLAFAASETEKPTTPAQTPTVSCQPMKLKSQNQDIVLPGATAAQLTQIYFIHNTSKQSVWIDHASKRRGAANAGWSSYLRPGNWSAILLDQKDFDLNCTVIQPGKVDNLNCVQSLSVCVPQKLSLHAKRKGSYWLVEDKNWDDMLKVLFKRLGK